MLKPLLTKNEVSTHLVGASTGSTAQPPCRRGGLGGGSFNNKKKKSNFTASSCQANSYTSSTHTQATIYQTDGERMFKMLIHKVRDIWDSFIHVYVSRRHTALVAILTSCRSVCLWLSQETKHSWSAKVVLLSWACFTGNTFTTVLTVQLGASHFTCLLGHKSVSTHFRHSISDEESFPRKICFSPLTRIGSQMTTTPKTCKEMARWTLPSPPLGK